MSSKIVWTTREWTLLAGEFEIAKRGIDDYGFTPFLKAAMEKLLPPERWRPMSGIAAMAKPPLHRALMLYRQNTPKLEPKTPPPEAQNELTTEALLVELAKRLAKLLEPATASFKPPVDRAFYPPPEATLQEAARGAQPKILIIGPKNGQQTELIKAHRGLDLRFVASDEGPTRIDSIGVFCDEIILWTNYLNHQHQVHAKATGRPTRYVSGGLTAIHERLYQWSSS